MLRFASYGHFALAFATAAVVATNGYAQDRSLNLSRKAATFDGQIVTRAYVRDFADLLGLDYIGHDYCSGQHCVTAKGDFAGLASLASGSALLSVQMVGSDGDPLTYILTETHCGPSRSTGVRSIRSSTDSVACLGGYQVLAQMVGAAS